MSCGVLGLLLLDHIGMRMASITVGILLTKVSDSGFGVCCLDLELDFDTCWDIFGSGGALKER